MSDDSGNTPQDQKDQEKEQELPPYVIEGARSSRSRCKTCRRTIVKGALRLGVLVEGRFGTGHMWHHLPCAAKRHLDRVEEAYQLEAWKEAKEPPEKVPPLEKLRKLQEAAEEKKKTRKVIPYTEPAPSGRARCKQCEQIIEKDSMRVVVGRDVEFGNQVRVAPNNVHPKCVSEMLDEPDCATERNGLEQALRANSRDVPSERIDEVMEQIGDVGTDGGE